MMSSLKAAFLLNGFKKVKMKLWMNDFQFSLKKFEVDVRNRILNQVVQSLLGRFVTHKKLFADLSYFDPKRFSETVLYGIPISAVNMICNLLPNKSSDSPAQQDLQQELLNFASK